MGKEIYYYEAFSPNRAPIQTSTRRLYCAVCDKTWEVDIREYSVKLHTPNWLHRQCGHWSRHEWKNYLYR